MDVGNIEESECNTPDIKLIINGASDTVNATRGLASMGSLMKDAAKIINLLLCIGGHLQVCIEGIKEELDEYVGQ